MSEAYDLLIDRLTNYLGLSADDLGPTVTFEELELDSFAMVELGLSLQEDLGFFLPEELDPQTTLEQAAQTMRHTAAEGAQGPQ
ncbi:acyl carrier protein [Lipingzhangella halophila]|uniref:Acyl carrier protein n=1 Tax=Lipingzhangella halophila TaxID=1783352 RepID=A0A7W7RH60_9ACTN|nr:acyl carrier protein [Lipingzhangella halophila]MBB4931894.1 acyl carrier protein [Lipingzhangella halophila]